MSLNGTCPQCKGDLQVKGNGWVVTLTLPVPVANSILIDSIQLVVVEGEDGQEVPVDFDSWTSSVGTGKRTLQWTASPTYVPTSARLRFHYQASGQSDQDEDEPGAEDDYVLTVQT